jgi:DHA2 family multidrug resistance protein
VALPNIQGNLGATLAEVGWISTGYACANVIMIPLTAWLSDRFGRKRYLLFSLGGFTAASVLCGVSTNLGMLIVARILQGLAGGGLLAKAQAILFETFPRSEQPAAQAIFGIGVIAGPAFGPVLGGYLTDTVGWRDWTGIGLLTLGLACFQIMLEQGQEDDWFSSNFIVMMAVGAAVGIGLLIWRELTIDYPAVDLRVLRYRSLSAGSTYSLILGMGIYGVIFAVPVFVQNYLHFTAMQSGLIQIPSAVASACAMLLMGKLSGMFDARLLIAIGAMITVSAALMLSHINPDTGAGSLFWPLFLRGLGSVCMFLPLSLATLGNLPPDKVSAGSGFYNLTRQLGSSIGIAIITTVLPHREAIHRAALVEQVNPAHPEMLSRVGSLSGALARHSADPVAVHNQAMALIDRLINGQALLLSFADVFLYVAVAFTASLPLLFLLGRGKGGSAPSAAH